MSHRIVGIDIGSYSVKVVQIETSFRTHDIVGYDEELVRGAHLEAPATAPEDEASEASEAPVAGETAALTPAVHQALELLRDRGSLTGDVTVVGYGLDRCLQTRIELPFSQRRQIEAVLPIQIEERLPLEIETLTSDFQVGEPMSEGGPRPIDVVTTPTRALGGYVAALGQVGIDPRVIEVGPAALFNAFHLLSPHATLETVVVLDIGHRFCDLCLIDNGRIAQLRRLRLGGGELTDRLVEALDMAPEQAEYHKHSDATVDVGRSASAVDDSRQAQIRRVASQYAETLVAELRRTFHGVLRSTGRPIERLALCGGGALLRGLPQFLADELGLPVEVLQVHAAAPAGPGASVRAVNALGLATRGLGRRTTSTFNLRRGPFAYRGDFDFLKARAVPLGIMAVFIVLGLIFTMVTQRTALAARRDAYRQALCDTSEALLDQPVCDPNLVMAHLVSADRSAIVPEYTAYEIFRDISADLVYLEQDLEIPVNIERMTVDIQRDVITIRGQTDSAESVDEIVLQLDTLKCVSGLTAESTTQNRVTEMFEFVLRAVNGCQ